MRCDTTAYIVEMRDVREREKKEKVNKTKQREKYTSAIAKYFNKFTASLYQNWFVKKMELNENLPVSSVLDIRSVNNLHINEA